MKFRKRPVVIEAEQWQPGRTVCGVFSETQGLSPSLHYYVVTAHGQRVYLTPGDWVIPEPDGRGYYPVKDDIFRDTYEPLEEDQ